MGKKLKITGTQAIPLAAAAGVGVGVGVRTRAQTLLPNLHLRTRIVPKPQTSPSHARFHQQERGGTQESTPCRDFDSNGSAVGPTGSIAGYENSVQRRAEMEELFVRAQKQQLQHFAEKYNFDFVKDVPLSGPYEWGYQTRIHVSIRMSYPAS